MHKFQYRLYLSLAAIKRIINPQAFSEIKNQTIKAKRSEKSEIRKPWDRFWWKAMKGHSHSWNTTATATSCFPAPKITTLPSGSPTTASVSAPTVATTAPFGAAMSQASPLLSIHKLTHSFTFFDFFVTFFWFGFNRGFDDVDYWECRSNGQDMECSDRRAVVLVQFRVSG